MKNTRGILENAEKGPQASDKERIFTKIAAFRDLGWGTDCGVSKLTTCSDNQTLSAVINIVIFQQLRTFARYLDV